MGYTIDMEDEMKDITNCPRCYTEYEVNNENYILGDEAIEVGKYSVWIDAHVTEDFDFVCRKCVIELVRKALDETS